MSIPTTVFKSFRISADQSPQKLLIRRMKFCNYLKFHPTNTFPRGLKLKILRYFKMMIIWGAKFKDEVSKPFMIYRQIFQRFSTLIHARLDFQPFELFPMKKFFLYNKQLNYHFVTKKNPDVLKYCRKSTVLLIHPSLDLKRYVKFVKNQRHSNYKMEKIYLRSNDPLALNEILRENSFQDLFPTLTKWTLFTNFPSMDLLGYEPLTYHSWKNLQWAYVSFDRVLNFQYFLNNIEEMKDLYSLEIVYYSVNVMTDFKFESLSKFERLSKVRTFSLHMSLMQVKDIRKFWNNIKFPPNTTELGFHITKSKFVTNQFYEPDILNKIREVFSKLTKVESFDAKLEFNEKLNTVHSYLSAIIINCFKEIKSIFLILAHFNRNKPDEDQICFLSLIYPVLSQLRNLQFFHFQGKILSGVYQKGALLKQNNPNFESLSIVADGASDHEILSFFEDVTLSNITKLRLNINLEISAEDFLVIETHVRNLIKIDQLSLSVVGALNEEDLISFFRSIESFKFIYTLKFQARNSVIQYSTKELINNILTYHRNLLNINVQIGDFTHRGNAYSYRVSL